MSSEEHQIKRNKEIAAEDLGKPGQVPGEEAEPGAEVEAGAEETVEESIEQQLDKAHATIKEYWEQILRLKAEIENNRKRSVRDIENAHKYALRNFSESLLPIVDSMEMAQKAAEAENASLESIIEGTELTMSMFIQVLEKHGLQELDPIGEKFDPEQHQAISMVEDKSAESNIVVSVMQKGFMLNERLVRPAMVVVSK
ncbi:MAG: nucleotide exchange factor GrpE [Gammaproteobacteria bacterium]|nr:MAG: nucleotide exchange factor GrpE [Gammaproteobacteria bacterium]